MNVLHWSYLLPCKVIQNHVHIVVNNMTRVTVIVRLPQTYGTLVVRTVLRVARVCRRRSRPTLVKSSFERV